MAVLGVVGGGWPWWGDSSEASLRSQLQQLAQLLSASPSDRPATRRARIDAAVRSQLASDARLRIAELPHVTVPGPALTDALTALVEPGEAGDVELTRIELDLRGDQATAFVDARLAGDVGRDLHAPHRQVTLGLVRRGDGWRIVDVEVPARKLEEPEPRP